MMTPRIVGALGDEAQSRNQILRFVVPLFSTSEHADECEDIAVLETC